MPTIFANCVLRPALAAARVVRRGVASRGVRRSLTGSAVVRHARRPVVWVLACAAGAPLVLAPPPPPLAETRPVAAEPHGLIPFDLAGLGGGGLGALAGRSTWPENAWPALAGGGAGALPPHASLPGDAPPYASLPGGMPPYASPPGGMLPDGAGPGSADTTPGPGTPPGAAEPTQPVGVPEPSGWLLLLPAGALLLGLRQAARQKPPAAREAS
ncbi:hypothetical protein [Siccirubricoccus phaeus]|uniref:hypothetical protein n=1 Tax=Siccirubricoccus phaeus TaxID=2595053 RepID=UPI0011F1FD5D|nr:hypothetical protein [Siccirubricoccus phaeus]